MASGGNEHRMLFDLRGRRRTAVKVVYAVLAVLMGLSLFLVVGPLNIGEIFNGESSTSTATKQFEEQTERIEAKLHKDPENPDLLLALTRAQVNIGNSRITVEPSGAQIFPPETLTDYQSASQSWSEYLEATDEPSSGLALLISPALVKLAEFSRSFVESESNIRAAAEAQRIVAEQRPSLNAYSTLALYEYFTDPAAAEAAKKKALSFTKTKAEREAVEKQVEEVKKRAQKFRQEVAKAEKQSQAAAKAKGGGAGLGGQNPLGGSFGGAGLGE